MTPQPPAGLDEAMIETLVHGFYDRIRADAVLGPIFAAHVRDWAPHLRQMTAFWSSVALTSGRYQGNPMQKHQPLPIGPAHFAHWLMIFEATARDLCPPAAAEHLILRARRIAASLEHGVAAARGELPRVA